jgi:Prolyl-tRNA synthetase
MFKKLSSPGKQNYRRTHYKFEGALFIPVNYIIFQPNPEAKPFPLPLYCRIYYLLMRLAIFGYQFRYLMFRPYCDGPTGEITTRDVILPIFEFSVPLSDILRSYYTVTVHLYQLAVKFRF